jgi:acetyl esterase/lipase
MMMAWRCKPTAGERHGRSGIEYCVPGRQNLRGEFLAGPLVFISGLAYNLLMKMRSLFFVGIALTGLVFGSYRLAGLQIFNFLIPKDAGSALIESRVSFGTDQSQTLDIYAPSTRNAGLPILVFVHGGSWQDGDARDYTFVGRAFAAQGFLTFVTNYRKRPDHEFPSFVEDAALALAFAQNRATQFGGAEDKIFAVGHSAGAYNLALAILDHGYLDAAGFNPKNLRGFAALAGPFDFLPLDTPITIGTFGQVRDLPSTQPVNFARADAPPMLLLTGTDDTTVYPRNSINLAHKLRKAGASVEIKEYQGIKHVPILLALAKPLRSWAPALDDVTSFFKSRMP